MHENFKIFKIFLEYPKIPQASLVHINSSSDQQSNIVTSSQPYSLTSMGSTKHLFVIHASHEKSSKKKDSMKEINRENKENEKKETKYIL